MSSNKRRQKASSSTTSTNKTKERRTLTSNVADGQPSSNLVRTAKRGRRGESDDDDTGKRSMKSIPRPPNAWILYRSAKSKEYSNRPLSSFTAFAPSTFSSDDAAAASKSKKATISSTSTYDKNRRNVGFVNQQGMSKMISDMWKTESQEIREHWRKIAEERKRQHMQMYPHYRFTPARAEGTTNKGKKGEGEVRRPEERSKVVVDEVEKRSNVVVDEDEEQTCPSATTERAGKRVSTSIKKRTKDQHASRARSKTLSISSSSRQTKRVDRSTSTDMLFQSPVPDDDVVDVVAGFSLDKLDWLPSDDGYLDQILSAASSSTEQPDSSKALRSAMPTTPDMLHVEQTRSNEDERRETEAALNALSAWQEAGFGNHDFSSHSHDCSLHATHFSLSSDAPFHPPSDHQSSHTPCDPRSASSFGDFTFAFDSLWHHSDSSWAAPEAVGLDKSDVGSSDQYDILTDISSAFLQSSSTESES